MRIRFDGADLLGGSENPGLQLVQDQMRHKPVISCGGRERSFDMSHPVMGSQAGRNVGHSRSVQGKRVEVEQCRQNVEARVPQ
ncbi:hypothetical protein FG87_20675 [Nocardia vulneris]|uniref:Uncharacterized protein n=1 Tax=Nocardia vulneris TaxID=1141657 RepID=A0ABR4ZDN6_9NOCA|nr:hypothetical protein FG87_20675 [Nocardia vulneris]